MSGAFKACVIRNQRFAAPDIAVGAVARAIQRESDDPSLDSIFRHARCDVRMVVLHTYESHALLSQAPISSTNNRGEDRAR